MQSLLISTNLSSKSHWCFIIVIFSTWTWWHLLSFTSNQISSLNSFKARWRLYDHFPSTKHRKILLFISSSWFHHQDQEYDYSTMFILILLCFLFISSPTCEHRASNTWFLHSAHLDLVHSHRHIWFLNSSYAIDSILTPAHSQADSNWVSL